MYCGDDNSGYVHIRKNHQTDWQTLLNNIDELTGIRSPSNWDDFMMYATTASLQGPVPGFPFDIGNQKLCYTAEIDFYKYYSDRPPMLLKTIYPSIIVSDNNKKVITSIPTTGAPLTSCYHGD